MIPSAPNALTAAIATFFAVRAGHGNCLINRIDARQVDQLAAYDDEDIRREGAVSIVDRRVFHSGHRLGTINCSFIYQLLEANFSIRGSSISGRRVSRDFI
jgi:hypothetical protein